MSNIITTLKANTQLMHALKISLIITLCCTPITSYAEAKFGRLFTTPAERANLDYLRKTAKPATLKQEPSEISNNNDEQLVAEPPAPISMQGYVKRSDGKKSTVWINNTPMQENSSSSQVQIGSLNSTNKQVQIKIPNSNKPLNLKAGQVYDPDSNMVLEKSAHAKLQAERELEVSKELDENQNN